MASQVLYGGFRRLGNFALDPTSVFKTYEEMQYYLTHNPTAYDGQQIVVTSDKDDIRNGLYTIHMSKDNAGNIEFSSRQSVDIKTFEAELKTQIKELEETTLTPISEKINTINKYLGISTPESGEETVSDKLISLDTRIDKIEDILLLSDPDESKHILDDINKNIEEIRTVIGDGGVLSEKYATKEELNTLRALVELLDNGNANDNSLGTLLLNLKDIDTKINNVKATVETYSIAITALSSRADVHDTEISNIKNKITEVNESILINKSNITKNLNEIQNLTNNLNIKITDVNNKIGTDIEAAKTVLRSEVNASLGSINTEISKLSSSIETNKTNIQKNEERISTAEEKIEKLSDVGRVAKNCIFSFSDSSKKDFNLSPNILIHKIRVLIEKASVLSNFTGTINIGSKYISTNEIYFDEVSEYTIDTFVELDGTSHILSFNPVHIDGNYLSNFNGASGKIFIEYYENPSNK